MNKKHEDKARLTEEFTIQSRLGSFKFVEIWSLMHSVLICAYFYIWIKYFLVLYSNSWNVPGLLVYGFYGPDFSRNDDYSESLARPREKLIQNWAEKLDMELLYRSVKWGANIKPCMPQQVSTQYMSYLSQLRPIIR